MRQMILAAISMMAVLFTPVALAQRGGGGRGGGTAQPGMGQPGAGQTGPGQTGGRQGQSRAEGTQDRTRDQMRDRVPATDQQRDQLRTCDQSAERVRAQARELAKTAKGGGTNNEDFSRQRDRLHEEIRTMQQEHERLMNGLGADQKVPLAERIRNMDRERERTQAQLQEMDGEFGKASPDRKRIQEHAREMERSMAAWQKEYRKMQEDMKP